MTYFITGATGFIGSNLIEHLCGRGDTVVAFDRGALPEHQRRVFEGLPGELVQVQGDVRDLPLLRETIARHGVSRVIHAAAITSGPERETADGPAVIDVNLVGTANVAQAAGEVGVERFVLAGSLGVYFVPGYPDGTVVDESFPHRPGSLYTISKSVAEAVARRICALHRQSFVIGRIGTAYGPWERQTGFRDTMSPVFEATELALRGEQAVFKFDRPSNWHYGRDAAETLVTLADATAPEHEDYNLGPAEVWAMTDWCARLAERLPGFRYEVGTPTTVEVYDEREGGRISGTRFAAEFGPTARFGIDAAFEDYMRWVDGRP
jgi:nucleoside-diphosphate-sugar epimerase